MAKLEVVPSQFEDGRYEFSITAARQIRVLRSDEKGGFQRFLDMRQVQEMMADLKAKGRSDYPEITVANVDGKLYCVDGQHRLLAHLEANIKVPVRVLSMTLDQAIDLFIRDNAKGRRLRRVELFEGSRAIAAKQARGLAKDHKVALTQVIELLSGMHPISVARLCKAETAYTDPEIRAAGLVLDEWTANENFLVVDHMAGRFGRPGAQASRMRRHRKLEYFFSSPSVMWCLGRIAQKHLKNMTKLRGQIRRLLSADWKLLEHLAATHYTARADLLNYLEREVLREEVA